MQFLNSHIQYPLKWLSLFLVSLTWLCMEGCALENGKPWGELKVSLEHDFEIPQNRKLGQNRIQTSGDYEITLEALSFSIDAVSISSGSGGSGATSFDPANPPPGYSLCHNGHCHHDDGRLVDYEEIELELQEETSSSGAETFAIIEDESISLLSSTKKVDLAECSNNCWVERGNLISASLVLQSMHLRATVVDRREGENRRLPEEGISLDVNVPISIRPQTALQIDIGRGETATIKLPFTFNVSSDMFDRIPWDSFYNSESPQALINTISEEKIALFESRLEQESTFEIE